MIHKCPACEKESLYNEAYDCSYCHSCNIWLEGPCDINNCYYCTPRPKNPINRPLTCRSSKKNKIIY